MGASKSLRHLDYNGNHSFVQGQNPPGPCPSLTLTLTHCKHFSASLKIEMDSKDPAFDWRVSAGLSGSTPRLSDGGPSRDRSLWSLQQRPLGGGGGSAWARSTTTRDSPVLSGLNDGLSSLFSVVEHSGSMESLGRGDAAGRRGARGFMVTLVFTFFRPFNIMI